MNPTFTTPDLCDENPDIAVLEPGLRHFGKRTRFSGPIATIRCPNDNNLVRKRVSEPGRGQVLIIDAGGWPHNSMFGGNLAGLAAANGWAGVIVNGYLRDVDELAAAAVGVMAKGTHPRRTEKHGWGEADVPVAFGGVTFIPGQFVYADENGVVVSAKPLRGEMGTV